MVIAGVGLTFGMWWVYFATPFGDVLVHRRSRGYLFGYGHMLLFIGVAGAGAGLHVAGLQLQHHSKIGDLAVVLALAVPVGLYLLMVYLLHTLLLSAADRLHLLLISHTLAVLAAAVLLAAVGVLIAICLLVVMLAPFYRCSCFPVATEVAVRAQPSVMLVTRSAASVKSSAIS